MKLEFESTPSTVLFADRRIDNQIDSANRVEDVSQTLQAGIKAAQEGKRADARHLLLQVTEAEPDNENAWLWLASISEYPEELLGFLNNILAVNPKNTRALEWSQATKSMLAKNFVQRGVDASNEAKIELARQCFQQAIAHDEQNEMAWLWMASISDSSDDKIAHLQKVLTINPNNETAHASLLAAKNRNAEAILQKANRAAISGEKHEANEMLQEVLEQNPELEEAWILKSYLAESFSEKITAFEKALSLNPENEAANSGLASLRAMMAKSESQKTERLAKIADFMREQSADAPIDETDNLTVTPEFTTEFTSEFQPPLNAQFETFQVENQTPAENFSVSESVERNFDNYPQSEQSVSFQAAFETSAAANENTATTNENAPNVAADNEPFVQTTEENSNADKSAKFSTETVPCAFCSVENESNAFACSACRAILTLSELEMLLANNGVERSVVGQTVGFLESEKAQRDLEADELKTLAIGHINLKNLRQGVQYLQAALRLNPNDVMLGSQINSLKIRLLEIEQQQSNYNLMTRGRTIMVIDDSATVRKLISSKLEKVGHEVVCAVDGVDALEKIKDIKPDLILLDINMPRMDGYQVCKIIRTDEATKDVPIVMISGNDGFFDKVRGRMSGTSGYITKPFGPETLMKTIESYII